MTAGESSFAYFSLKKSRSPHRAKTGGERKDNAEFNELIVLLGPCFHGDDGMRTGFWPPPA